jgi:hypothetical protein
LISQVKVIWQDQKNFDKEINIRYDVMPSAYPQEFITSILKPSRSSHHSSEKPYQGTVIPYVKGISEKFKCIGNQFNVRAYFQD